MLLVWKTLSWNPNIWESLDSPVCSPYLLLCCMKACVWKELVWVGFRSRIWTTAFPEGSAQWRTAKAGESPVWPQSCPHSHWTQEQKGQEEALGLSWYHSGTLFGWCYHHPHGKEHHPHHKKANLREAAHLRKYGHNPGSCLQKPHPAESPCPSWKVWLLFGSTFKVPKGLLCACSQSLSLSLSLSSNRTQDLRSRVSPAVIPLT